MFESPRPSTTPPLPPPPSLTKSHRKPSQATPRHAKENQTWSQLEARHLLQETDNQENSDCTWLTKVKHNKKSSKEIKKQHEFPLRLPPNPMTTLTVLLLPILATFTFVLFIPFIAVSALAASLRIRRSRLIECFSKTPLQSSFDPRSHDSIHVVNARNNVKDSVFRLLVVLGSGGHTAEMITFLQSLSQTTLPIRFEKVTYVYADSDPASKRKALSIHTSSSSSSSPSHKSNPPIPNSSFSALEPNFVALPRARNVGQSYFTSVFTTLRAFVPSYTAVRDHDPHIVLLNGPGTCLPLAVCALLRTAYGSGNARVIYVESVARIKSLSLTGKLLYPFVHRFIVMSEELSQKYPLAEYHGRLV